MSVTVLIPKVTAAAITPSPATINQPFTLSLTIIEESVILDPYYYYAGDIYAGEV